MKIRPIRTYGRYLALESEGVPELQSDYEAFCKALADAVVLTGDVYQTLPPDMRLHPDAFLRADLLHPAVGCQNVRIERVFQKTYRWAGCLRFGLLVGYQGTPETTPAP